MAKNSNDHDQEQPWWLQPLPVVHGVSKRQEASEKVLLMAWSEAWGEHLQQLYAQAEEDFRVGRIQEIGDDLKEDEKGDE